VIDLKWNIVVIVLEQNPRPTGDPRTKVSLIRSAITKRFRYGNINCAKMVAEVSHFLPNLGIERSVHYNDFVESCSGPKWKPFCDFLQPRSRRDHE